MEALILIPLGLFVVAMFVIPEVMNARNRKARAAAPHTPDAPAGKLDVTGAWCPHCGNRNSVKEASGAGCLFWVFVLFSIGLALLVWPFLPKQWVCLECKNQWRA